MRQLRDQLSRIINIDLLLEDSGAQIQIEAPLEVFADQILVHRHLSECFKLIREEVVRSIFGVFLLELLLLILIE